MLEGSMETNTEPQNGVASDVNKPRPLDEKAPDSSDSGTQKTKNAKGKKRKKPKDSTAPKPPLTGYVRYLNERRDFVKKQNPNFSFAEITKILAGEWSTLSTDKKQLYLNAAEQDRERYVKEYNAYKQTDAFKLSRQQSEKKMKDGKEDTKTPILQTPTIGKDGQNHNDIDFSNNFDIPIFTEEFLDHNKTRDAELRQLRKSNTDYEQQNAILQKHIENMKSAIEKLENEILQQKKNNVSLQQHLDRLRSTLTNGFANIKLPGVKETATLQTIDSYMTNLHSMLLENNSQDASLLQTIRDIVGRMEFNG